MEFDGTGGQLVTDRAHRRLLARIAVIDDLLADNRKQLERLLDLYLAGDFPRDALTDGKARLETTIAALAKERTELVAHLEADELTESQIATLTGYVQRLSDGIDRADADFATRRKVIEAMNVQATPYVEDGRKMVRLTCLWQENVYKLCHAPLVIQ